MCGPLLPCRRLPPPGAELAELFLGERDAGHGLRLRTAPSCGGRREAPPLSHALCVVDGARCLAARRRGLPRADPRPRARLHQRQGPADARSGAQAKRSLTRRPLSMLTRAATPLWPHSSLTPSPPARRATPSSTSSSSTTSSRNGSCCDGRTGRRRVRGPHGTRSMRRPRAMLSRHTRSFAGGRT